MMNRIYKTNFIKRSLLVGMAAVTLFTSVAAPAKAVLADTYDTNMDYDELNEVDPKTASLIIKAAGKIPYAGSLVGALEPMFNELLGTGDDTPAKLQEISSKMDKLELKMDESATKQLAAMYKSSRLTQFDHDITTVRNMTASYYRNIATYLSNPKTSEAEKALLIGAMLDTNTTSTVDYLSVVETLTSFVNGDQINDNPESICVASYNAYCASSVLGSEAAMKNASYVKEVVSILDYAYRFEALVLESKIILADNLSKMTEEEKKEIKKKYEGIPAESKLIAECGIEDKVTIWKRNAGIIDEKGEVTGVKRKYYLVIDTDNPNSAVSKYNKMVEKNWCSFIRATDYSDLRAKITMVPIKLAIGKDYNAKNVGIKKLENYNYNDYENMTKGVSNRLNSNVKNSALTPDEIYKLIEHVNKESILCPPKSFNWQYNLDYLGFDAGKAYRYVGADGEENYDEGVSEWIIYQMRQPIFVTGATEYNNFYPGQRGCGIVEKNSLTINYVSAWGEKQSYKPIDIARYLDRGKLDDKCDTTYHQYLWFEKADSEAYSNDEEDNAYNMSEIEAIDSEIRESLRIDEVEEEEEDDIYAATDLTVVWNTRDGQMIPKEAVSIEIGYGVTLTATSSNNWKSEVVDLILYDETGDYAYNFVDDSLYGLISELSDDFIVTTDVITEKDENGFDERHFIVYCDAIAEEDVPEYDDPVIYEDEPEYDAPL